MDEYRKASICVILFITAVLLLCVFFCAAAIFTSYGYKQSLAARYNALQVVSQSKNTFTLVIDPGHGGEDPGCVSGKHIEKDINLSISLYLADFLLISDTEVELTRTDDRLLYYTGQEDRKKFYDLRNRLGIAENANNGVYIGIHVNKFPIAKYKGLQTFYSDNREESRVLAQYIQECSLLIDPENTRKIKPDGDTIYILEHIKIPAVLIECGFISNEKEAEKLEDKDYQKRLAFAVFCGITRWLGGQYEN